MLKILGRQVITDVTLRVSQRVQAEFIADLQFMQQGLIVAKDIAETANKGLIVEKDNAEAATKGLLVEKDFAEAANKVLIAEKDIAEAANKGLMVARDLAEAATKGLRVEKVIADAANQGLVIAKDIAEAANHSLLIAKDIAEAANKGLLAEKDFAEAANKGLLIAKDIAEAANKGLIVEKDFAEAANEGLLVAKDIAEAANKRKGRVLAYVSHELKNPLNATVMFGNFLEKGSAGKLSTIQTEYVQHMLTGCEHLREVMSDLLEIAPVEAGLFKPTIKLFSLHKVIAEVVTLMSPAAAIKLVTLNAKTDSVDFIEGDERRIRQILINLLSNAIKYTNEADTVEVETAESDFGVQIVVHDHGPGIEEKDIQKLFQDYYRVQNHLEGQKEGMGLGLALSKKLVELHQGRISVKSNPEEGTRFIVELPLKQVKEINGNPLFLKGAL